jgi:cell division protein FtsW
MAVIIYMAYYVDKKREKLKDFQTGLLPPLGILTIIMGLIVIQPDFSTAAMIGVIGIIILFIGGVRLSQLSLAGAASLLVGIPVLMAKQYRRDRIFYYLGLTEGQSVSYQPNQSLISLGNGGVFGAGLGNSIEKNHFLPTPHTDFIFSIIGEELGLILGTIPILTLFLLIFFRGLKIARECMDPFGVFLAVGISFNLILYAFVNAAVVTGLFPVTGLPMPLVSYGGSGMVINMAMIGILLNISQARRSVGGNRGWSPALYG